jgi:hypothetical protein
MVRLAVVAVALMLTAHAFAADSVASHVVDLREPRALEELQRTNPAHFAKIQQVMAGLMEQPMRAEGKWLQVTVDARDVDLSRNVIRTSYPPKQLLQFTLDDSRYIMHVVRTDLVPKVQQAR